MTILIPALIAIAIIVLIIAWLFSTKKKTVVVQALDDQDRRVLIEQVPFYIRLDEHHRVLFEHRMQHFLAGVTITGVNTTVEQLDRVLIAASAVIPIFGFPDWEYTNLDEILVYPDSFNDQFEQTGSNRNTLGMVGTGAMHRVMILSQHELRQGFINKTGKSNTAIHEFVHLVDKTDGSTDGVPEFIVQQQYIVPWLQLMHREIQQILKNRSDINPYGATNEAEFFAVVSEYFFERPDLLEAKHPELYKLLTTIFRQKPAIKK